ncbi:MAG TPA: hypothetical protein PKD27_01735 [Tepidiformaceae bacterium]|nr:hypothetical protein [Tepidiformaceae bacterium]
MTWARDFDGVLGLLLIEYEHLIGRARIAQVHADQEAVELRFRKRERSFIFDRVLRGEHHERLRKLVGGAIDGHLALLHRFEQRGLRLRRGAVHLVGEHYLGDDRPGPELKAPGLLVVNGNAADIRGKQVGCELDSAEAASGGDGDCSREHRLPHPWHVLNQHMPAAEERGHGKAQFALLPDDDVFDVRDDPLGDDFRVFHEGSLPVVRISRTTATPRRRTAVGDRADYSNAAFRRG